jgi:pyruvate dehydrogenase E2 component (dihydrolipoamide acetyltransferase)
MEEGTVDEWLAADGDLIAVGDPLLRLATDKVDVDVEAEAAGRFHRAVPAGTTLPLGAVLGWLLEDGEEPPVGAASPAAAPPAAPAAVAAPAVSVLEAPAPTANRGEGGRLLSSPLARRLAGELAVDLATVSGTGPGGRIVAADVQEASVTAPRSAGVVSSPLVRRDAAVLGVDLTAVQGTGHGGRITRIDVRSAGRLVRPTDQVSVIPLKGMRGAIASRMVASLHEMAQLTHGFEVCMDEVVAVRDQLKRDWPELGLTVPSLNDFIVRAAALALRENPGLNATVVDNEIRVLPEIHVGMAVAIPGGLVVPVIRDADRLSLQQLAVETRSLATRARDGKLALTDLEGGTFAVTSLGTYGVDFFTPVINPGNVAILGVGRMRDGVRWTDDDRPLRTKVLTLSLTFDHRAVDGAPAAEYLQTLAELLSRPLVLLPEA